MDQRPKCAACPLRRHPAASAARTLPHPPFCEHAAAGGQFDEAIAKASGVEPADLVVPPLPALRAPAAGSRADPLSLGGRRRFHITQRLALGDWAVITALIRDLKLAYGDAIELDVTTPFPDLFAHNPHVSRNRSTEAQTTVKVEYGAGLEQQKFETVHFLSWLHRDFERQTGIPVPVRYPYPDLHLSPAELTTKIIGGGRRYWVMVAGGKEDFTAKWWARADWQVACNLMRDAGLDVVQVGATDEEHWHPPLDGALNLVGKTTTRALLRLIAQSEGVVCGVTGAMHIAAGLHKPCVVLAGGREAWWWEAYVNENKGFGPDASGRIPVPHRFLHTIGRLECCATHGCWKSVTEQTKKGQTVCRHPIPSGPGRPIAKCMTMIRPSHVLEAVMSYYRDDALPPIGDAEEAAPAPTFAAFAVPVNLAPPEAPTHEVLRFSPDDASPVVQAPPAPLASFIDRPVFDDPSIGGQFTIVVHCRGDRFPLHAACIDGLLQTLPAGRAEIRVASVDAGARTLAMVDRYAATQAVAVHRKFAAGERKYRVMREMFRDATAPIRTRYVIWVDDDTRFDKTPVWLSELAAAIADGHPRGARIYGPRMAWQLRPGQVEWIRQSAWFRGRTFRDAAGKDAPNGQWIHHPAGCFFALDVETMRDQDIPDPRLQQDGDYIVGEQVHQGGGDFKWFSTQRQFVNWGTGPKPASPPIVVGVG